MGYVTSSTTAVGDPAPSFTLTAVDGTRMSLDELKGQAVVLVFLRGFF